MMIKMLFILLSLLLGTISHAADSSSEEVQQNEFTYYEFYRAKRESRTVYIHGTMHTRSLENNPPILNRAIQNAKAIYIENFRDDNESSDDSDGVESTDDVDHSLKAKLLRKDKDPDWINLFKTHPFLDGSKTTNLYTYLKDTCAENINILTHGLSFDEFLKNTSAFGIFTLICTALNQETSNPNLSYDRRLFDMFRTTNKPTEFLETMSEIQETNLDGLYPDSITQILEKSGQDTLSFLNFICEVISGMEQELKQHTTLYKSGRGIILRRLLPNSSPFIDARTSLWFTKYFGIHPQPIIDESLFCMGLGHLHPHINESYGILTPGFLCRLEEGGWRLENLSLNGAWIPWSTKSHLDKLRQNEEMQKA
jgi:hypothetical protein